MDWDASADYSTARGRTLAYKLFKSIQSVTKQLDSAFHFAEIRLLWEESAELLRVLSGLDPQQYVAPFSRALCRLGAHLYRCGYWEKAERSLREAARLCRQCYHVNSDSERNRAYLALALHEYAKSLESLGRTEEAKLLTSEALGLRRKIFETRLRSGAEFPASLRSYGDFLFLDPVVASDSE